MQGSLRCALSTKYASLPRPGEGRPKSPPLLIQSNLQRILCVTASLPDTIGGQDQTSVKVANDVNDANKSVLDAGVAGIDDDEVSSDLSTLVSTAL